MQKYELIIIGAGPAGIAAAVEGRLKNKSVLILEKGSEICQTLRVFYKDGKRVDKAYKGLDGTNHGHLPFEDGTKESTLETFAAQLEKYEIPVEFGSEVESLRQVEGGFIISTGRGSYEGEKIIIAIGRMGKPNKPDYKLPPSLNKVINFNANSALAGEKILIIGGGNSAAEYAVDLAEKCKITLCYRRKEFTRLNEINLRELTEAGAAGKVSLRLGVDISKIEDENGEARVSFSDGGTENFTRVIYAIGGSTPLDFLAKCGVEVDERGVPVMDEKNQSSQAGIYLIGDIATKNGASIITGLNDAIKVINALC